MNLSRVFVLILVTGIKLREATTSKWTGLHCLSNNYSGKNLTTWHQTTTGEWRCCVDILCPQGQSAVPCQKSDPTSTTCQPCPDHTYLSHRYLSSVGHKCEPKSFCHPIYGLVKVDNGTATRDANCLCDLSRGYYMPEKVAHHRYCYGPKHCPVGRQLVQNGSCVLEPFEPDKRWKVTTTSTSLSFEMSTGVSQDYELSTLTDRTDWQMNTIGWQQKMTIGLAAAIAVSVAIVASVFLYRWRQTLLTRFAKYTKRKRRVRSQSECEMEAGDGGGGTSTQRTGGAGTDSVALLEEDEEGNPTGNDAHPEEETHLVHDSDDCQGGGVDADRQQGCNEEEPRIAQDNGDEGAAVDSDSEILDNGAERQCVDAPLVFTDLQPGNAAPQVRGQGQGQQHQNVEYHLHIHGDIKIKNAQLGTGNQMHRGSASSGTSTPSQSSDDEQDDISVTSNDSSSLNDN